MAESKAAKLAESFREKGTDASLPDHVKEAIDDVEYHAKRQSLLLDAALARGEIDQEHYDDHPRRAYRFEEVDGEVVEISKNGKGGKLLIKHLPGVVAGEKVDLANVDPTNIDLILGNNEED